MLRGQNKQNKKNWMGLYERKALLELGTGRVICSLHLDKIPSLQQNIYDSHKKTGTIRALPENRFIANFPAPLIGLSEKDNGRYQWDNLVCGIDLVQGIAVLWWSVRQFEEQQPGTSFHTEIPDRCLQGVWICRKKPSDAHGLRVTNYGIQTSFSCFYI